MKEHVGKTSRRVRTYTRAHVRTAHVDGVYDGAHIRSIMCGEHTDVISERTYASDYVRRLVSYLQNNRTGKRPATEIDKEVEEDETYIKRQSAQTPKSILLEAKV